MHFFTTLLAATAALASTAAASPVPATECNGLRCSRTDFHITKFYGSSIPHSESAKYHFFVSGGSQSDPRTFQKIRCYQKRTLGTAYQSLIPVHTGFCDDPHVTFNFKRYQENGKDAGWQLQVLHYIYQNDK
jgi:hypothetical protein